MRGIHRLGLTFALLAGLTLPAAAAQAPARQLPVGYDQPGSHEGGPRLPDGLGWIDVVQPRALPLAPKPAGGKPSVVALVSSTGAGVLHGLSRRFPMDLLHISPPGIPAHQYSGREDFAGLYRLLASGKRVDVFAVSRVDMKTVPTDVVVEILRRVTEEGSGLLVVDLFDPSEFFSPAALGLKPAEQGPDLIPGIPYAGLSSWATGKEMRFQALNYWQTNGVVRTEPAARPLKYDNVQVSPFGKGRVVWVQTGTSWDRYWGARPLLPQVHQRRSRWIDLDYFYSHTAKALRLASGRVPAVRVGEVACGSVGPWAAGRVTGEPARGAFTSGSAFTGRLRWQVRDTWGDVSAKGEMPLRMAVGEQTAAIPEARLRHAGPQYLDLWVESAAGETVDWGSGFADVDRGFPPPRIERRHPVGTPRGAPLEAKVLTAGAPVGAVVRATLIDRHWRVVGRQALKPAASGAAAFAFPSHGLDGQIWHLQADLVAPDGTVLSRARQILTSPHGPATRGGFHPLMTGPTDDTPEASAQREYLRRIGFLGNRPYTPGDGVTAEAGLWNDIQPFPFPFRVTGASNDFAEDHLTDWQDPEVARDLAEATALLLREQGAFGVRGINLTDDSSPSGELPLGAYTTAAFHEWLKGEYGSFEGVCKAWGWTPEVETAPAGELPYDAHVTLDFHQWLRRKHGDLPGVAKAWKLRPEGFGSMHTFGSIQREMIEKQRKAGNALPAEDARAFLAEQGRAEGGTPFGRVHAESIRKAREAGVAAPWVDARRFLQKAWVDNMARLKVAARRVKPGLLVGTDAAFYGSALSEAFGRLDYLGPYYDDRAVKVAVSRGRMRRQGDYGACLGSYGEKPADQSGRRGQIWDVLFAGGNAFYYWAFGDGMRRDLTLSDKHARAQCEVVEEITGGIGELFTGCRRLFDPVALLDSRTSAICDALAEKGEAVTTQAESIGAFQYALEDLGLNPHTITGDELAGGWLAEQGCKLLVLPGASSLSDGEIAAVRAFVQAGGTVVADIIPGVRAPNGNVRAQAPLADLFGVAFDAAAKPAPVRGGLVGKPASAGAAATSYGEALADPRVRPTTAASAASVEGRPALLSHTFGQGKAFLLNASFDAYPAYRAEGGPLWDAWQRYARSVAAAAGLSTAFPWTSEGKPTPGFEVSPFANGPGYLLGVEDLGCGDFTGPRRPVEVKLPRPLHQYDIRAGRYLGMAPVVRAPLPRSGHRAYALLPYKVVAVTLRADKPVVVCGETVSLTVDVVPQGKAARILHVVRVEARDPSGSGFFPFRRVLRMPAIGPLVVPLTTALNDAPGTWTFTATDVSTGVDSSTRVALKPAPGPGVGGKVVTLPTGPGESAGREPHGDSGFRAGETHAAAKVAEAGKRQGCDERKDTVRFGRYSLSVTQRLDPATGFPPREGQVWGDTFVGIGGKKPASYMASNWSPWDFLSAAIRLAGDKDPVPNPTRMGVLAYAVLREQTPERVVAEVAWKDTAGGMLRARCVGWPGSDRFGLALRYFPPAGKQVESLAYQLVCQPYDYSDRGYWQRRRCFLTPKREADLGKEPVALDPAAEGQVVFHNRCAQNDAGTLLALDAASVRQAALSSSGNTVTVALAPADPDGEMVLVLGDWVDRTYPLARAAFFAEGERAAAELKATRSLALPLPGTVEDASIQALLKPHEALLARFGPVLAKAAGDVETCRKALAAGDTPSAFAAWHAAEQARRLLCEDARTAWATGKAWAR